MGCKMGLISLYTVVVKFIQKIDRNTSDEQC